MLRRYGVVYTDAWGSETSTSYYRRLFSRHLTRAGAIRSQERIRRLMSPCKGEGASEPRLGWWFRPGYEVVDVRTLTDDDWLSFSR